ncbi:MAG: TerB family tellurite resistance protein [Pseudomonadota bacterium]
MLLRKLKALLEKPDDQSEISEEELQLATAALLVEVARADFKEDPQEQKAILSILERHFDMASSEAHNLFSDAELSVDESVSLHEFTSKLHQRLDPAAKHKIIKMMWQVAIADGVIDRYEDYVVRKVADLLYVDHVDFMRLKHDAIDGT